MTITLDYARCPGADWDECRDCQRRTAPPGPNQIAPPPIVTLWCENYIAPDGLIVQRLQELAQQINHQPPATTP